ncbi:MAG: hypothetical protein HY336_00155 [Candidatus Doudnabacteria bacterium]|nr:hypothetical protein [Candidatus Doudnabacteria bacterium]
MKKKVTIESLASMVNKGFDQVHGEINRRFDRVENNMEEIKLKLDNVAYRFGVR